MKYKLIELNKMLEGEFRSYIDEWNSVNEMPIPTITQLGEGSYDDLLDKLNFQKSNKVYKQGLVPATLYCLVDDNLRIYGCVHIRHELNDFLLNMGGHVGYGVRPSERGNALAKLMMELITPILKGLMIDRVLLTCDKTNIGSAKTIISCGGILENEVNSGDRITQRYWISLL